jgi:hypothetical protein
MEVEVKGFKIDKRTGAIMMKKSAKTAYVKVKHSPEETAMRLSKKHDFIPFYRVGQ